MELAFRSVAAQHLGQDRLQLLVNHAQGASNSGGRD
jgi:hypothetical protein